jgi:hypothetical protein
MAVATVPIYTSGVLSMVSPAAAVVAAAAGSTLGFEYSTGPIDDADILLPVLFTDRELREKIAADGGPIELGTATSAELAMACLRAKGKTAFDRVSITSLDDVDGTTAGGTAVEITGTGFSNGRATSTTVTFGGDAATSVVVVSNTVITCVTPAHAAAAVDVVVTNSNGSATDAAGFTYS